MLLYPKRAIEEKSTENETVAKRTDTDVSMS